MSRKFLLDWAFENVQADAFQKGRTEAERLADQLAAAAATKGISRRRLETVTGEPLPNFLYVVMEDAAVLVRHLLPQNE